MDKTIRQSMRAILTALNRESRIPPVTLLLEASRRTVSPGAPQIIKAVKRKYQVPPAVFPIRLRMTDKLLPLCPRPVPPVRTTVRRRDLNASDSIKEQVRSRFPPMAEVVATDDSDCDHRPVLDGSGRLGPAEVFDAEANGALKGLRATVGPLQATAKEIVVCLDNLAAATGLRGTPSDS
ncbi:hypothetical protein MAJ_07954, partial [Metarhizium majus ARSEF 297]